MEQSRADAVFVFMSKPKLTKNDFCRTAKKLKCDVAAIKAVAHVESKGEGFYADGFPVILFERHKFQAFTHKKFSAKYPAISGPQGNYGKAGQHQRDKFNLAFSLDPEAAMMSCSWGKFQVMGFNWDDLGYDSIHEFVDKMKESEGEHLDAFARFVIANGLTDELRRLDWAGFARGYNGPAYKENHYDTKMAAAYKKYKAENIDCDEPSPFADLADDEIDMALDSAVPASVPPVDTVKRDEQTDPPSTPPKDQPDEQPPPVTQLANTIVNNGDSTPPAKNVVIEKGDGWFKRKWREIVAFVTGNSLLDGWSERLAQVQALGLPPRFWTNLIYFTVGGAVIYFAFDWYRDYQGRKLTNKLIDANSTATNLVRVAPSSKIDDMYAADPNWEVIKKN